MMKKRERKGQARKRVTDSDEEDNGTGDGSVEEVKRKTLEEIREEQRQRKARAGLQAASTLDAGEESKKERKKKGQGGEDGDEEEQVQEKTIGERMESSFTGIRYMAKRDDSMAHKKIMEEYIQEKMGIKKDEKEVEETAASGKLSKRDKLLQITREIQPEVPEDQTFKNDEGIGQGAPIAYSTGIAEVALPIEVKLRNIEETEKAKRALEQKQRRGGNRPDYDNSIIGNLTTNYHLFRRDHAEKMREKDQRERERAGLGAPAGRGGGGTRGGGNGGGHTQGFRGKDTMSDDVVYERFKKRARR